MFSRNTGRFFQALTLAAALVTGGCARLLATYDVAPSGLSRTDEELRRYFAFGQFDSAMMRLTTPNKKAQLPKDELLRSLYEGVTAHYAGDYARSTAAFDRADMLAEDRVTKSISKAALSVLVNDMSLEYEPSRTERLLIPYYAALSYLRAGNAQEAAVEARRLSFLLQSLADERNAPNRELHAFLRNFAGIVFEAAGQYADADVAYRNAQALDSVRYTRGQRSDSTGEVIVLIEHGFAPHRVQESLVVVLGDEETHDFDDEDEDRRRVSALRVAARVLEYANTSGPRLGPPRSRMLMVPAAQSKASEPHRHHRAQCDSTANGTKCKDEEDHSYILRMSWPVMYDYAPIARPFSVFIDSTAVSAIADADIARSVLEDFRSEQAMIVARTVGRAMTKYAMTRGIEKEAAKKDSGLGKLAGVLANLGGAITEQADTRSWHFVPAAVSLVRVTLPAGTHRISVDHGGDARRDLGAATIAGGGVSVLSTRIW